MKWLVLMKEADVISQCSENKNKQTEKKKNPKGFRFATRQYYPVVSMENNNALP